MSIGSPSTRKNSQITVNAFLKLFEGRDNVRLIYKTIDSIPKLSGYQVLIGHIDNDNNILCWEMSYDYFLNQRLIDQIPVLKFENKNLKENSEIKKMKNTFVYIPLPKDNKKLYKKIVKKINYQTSGWMS
jgi:hypothetical protein